MAGLSARASQVGDSHGCLDLVGLSPLMARTSGRPEIDRANRWADRCRSP